MRAAKMPRGVQSLGNGLFVGHISRSKVWTSRHVGSVGLDRLDQRSSRLGLSMHLSPSNVAGCYGPASAANRQPPSNRWATNRAPQTPSIVFRIHFCAPTQNFHSLWNADASFFMCRTRPIAQSRERCIRSSSWSSILCLWLFFLLPSSFFSFLPLLLHTIIIQGLDWWIIQNISDKQKSKIKMNL